jgi:predicted ATPase
MARQFSLEFLKLAEKELIPGLMPAGNFLLGSSLFHLGRLGDSLRCMNEAVRTTAGPAESILTLFAGGDVGVFCRSYLSHITWHCGDDNQALAHSGEAVKTAQAIRDPFSQAIALNYAAMLHVFRGESRSALEHGLEAVATCERYGFAYYLAMANILTGWARSAHGSVSDGLTQLREGLEGMRRLEAELRLPFYFKLLAEALSRADQISEALANLSTAFAFATKNKEEWAAADLYLVHGELLAAQGKSEIARESFERGLEAARRSGSVALERKLSIVADRTRAIAATERC